MKHTPFFDWHMAHGASMVEFHGWEMPLYHRGITEEHLHTRRSASLFDLGHMGRIMVHGPRSLEFVNWLTPAALSATEPGDVLYSFLLDEAGHTIDDITIYVGAGCQMLVVNAGNHDAALAWIQQQADSWGNVAIEDKSYTWSMIALQGPSSDHIIKCLPMAESLISLPYYKYISAKNPDGGFEMIMSTTGYTGEHGYELYMPAESALQVWNALVEFDSEGIVAPAGLGARDSLRLEAAMPLYGHELNSHTTPLEAGLRKFIDFNKIRFMGKGALSAITTSGGPDKKLICFEMKQRGPVPRQAMNVLSSAGQPIGSVTSGIFSPTLQKNIGMAYVTASESKTGNEILLDIRGRNYPALVVKKPFYKRMN